jgi:ABC-type phosphate transport system substrate-binding protein
MTKQKPRSGEHLMSVRKISAKLGLAAVAVSGLALTALAPANADTVPGHDSVPGTYTLGTTVIGVGSDTLQWVDDKLSADYDATTPAVAWANFDACLGNTSAGAPGLGDNPDGSGFPCGADHTGTKAGVKRDEGVVDPAAAGGALPSGSGDGRTLLRTPTDKLFMDVAYGRSSGPINTTDLAAGEIALPFAVDKIVVATHPGGPAPASLTGQQILKIYNGTYTNWNQVGGKNATIHPYLPKAGSSTLNAFQSFLAALDGVNEAPGTDNDPTSHSAASQIWQGQPGAPAITDGNWNTGSPTAVPPTAANVEEHDPSVIIKDANAIEPFSYGRAQLANGASQTVRIEGGWSADRELYHVVRGQNIAGAATTPFVYGSDGGVLENLFSNTGWVCTNATAKADIAGAGFWPLQTGTTTGRCGVKNANTEDTINPFASNGVDEGAATSTSAFFHSGTVHVTVTGGASTPTGSVQLVVANPSTPTGSPAASYHKTVALNADGEAAITLPATVSGMKTFDVAYLPTSFGAKSSAGGHTALGSSYTEFSAKIPVAKVATTVKASAKPTTLASSKANTKVTATVKAVSGTAKPTGTITIMLGSKKVGTGKLKNGTVTITVKGTSLKKGTNKLVVRYVPTTGFKAPAKSPSVTVHRTK